MPDTSPLPTMPAWQARSFWLTLIGAGTALGAAFGLNFLEIAGFESEESMIESVMMVVAGVATVWAWFERRAPNFKLGA